MDSSLGVNTIDHPYILPNKECLRDLDLFFANGLYNSCQATDELIKNIEQSHDESLARKALNLYQHHFATLERPWDHVTFMYGLGLIYMHFNAYNWAVKSFREALYVQPNFARSRDVHTRLGLIFKATGRYRLSEKHFNLAINDRRPNGGTSSQSQLKFYIANLYEIQGKVRQAIGAYENLLKENDLPQQLIACIHRQLGWLYLNDSSNNYHNQLDAALECFNTSYQTDNDPKTSYYLGRCFTNIGKFQDAFASYRSVIDREESTADTWCSIGVLYHRQNQPMDALQAYIRSVQFDKRHSDAWMNLGILYESYNQFHDALKCYLHVLRSKPNQVDSTLQARVKYIKKIMAEIDNFSGNDAKSRPNSDKLLSLEDLWNLESKTSSEANINSSNGSDTSQVTNSSSNDKSKLLRFSIEKCKNLLRPNKLDVNLLSDEEKPPSTMIKPPPYPPLAIEDLFPSPPSVFLETKKDIISKKIQEICQLSPISIVRNIATVLKLDLGLFSTKTLVESNPDQQIDTVSHSMNDKDEQTTNLWSNECHQATSTISGYASYQVASFRESLEEERDRRETLIRKLVRAATGIDLSDERKWRSQLHELNKLPHFLKCVSASNMLTYIGAAIQDINTVTMGMHIPGCKIIGNKTPNNFCQVNINVGPGDYEWCAVPAEYRSIFLRICNKYGFDFSSSGWWPRLSDLQKHNIPIYRFSQRPGDLVWINSGTICWVRATGWCNNIYWNVGPLNAKQYKLASESTEFNKLTLCKSDVPMVQLTWNIAININFIPDEELWQSIVGVLRRSLKYCASVRELVDELRQEIYLQEGEFGPKNAKYCSLCEIEVFNICFYSKSDNCLHCVECARRADSTLNNYEIKQEYDIYRLMKLYDNFSETNKESSKMGISRLAC